MKHFSYQELIQSDTALAYGITNLPSTLKQFRALTELVEKVLDPLREAIGCPIYVNSGYRSQQLNAIVGGVPNSQHCKGEAADITTRSKAKNQALWRNIIYGDIIFDQAIFYRERNFIHISYSFDGENRMDVQYR